MSSTYTQNLGLQEPATGDLTGTWGPSCEAPNKQILDNAIAGQVSLNLPGLAGYPTVSLTFVQGSSVQNLPNRRLILTGTLTANTIVLFPQGRNFDIDVQNNCTGAFTVTLGVTNNSVPPGILGTSVVVPQGQTMALYGDGTNVNPDGNSVGGALSVNGNLNSTATINAQTDVQVNGTSVVMPSGVILGFAGSSAPTGWLMCDGSSYATATYPNLFAAIGYTYGGSGANFNVPDSRGRVLAGNDSATGRLNGSSMSGNSPGSTGGEATVTLTTSTLPAHAHSINDPAHTHGVNDPQHSHSISNGPGSGNVGGGGTSNPPGVTQPASTGISLSAAQTGISINNTGSGNPHDNVQPTLIVNHIIKT